MSKDLDSINDVTMKELLIEIKKLQQTVLRLENQINENNSVLVNHIGFVNGVFDTIKSPLLFIMDKINKLFINGLENEKIKELENENENIK